MPLKFSFQIPHTVHNREKPHKDKMSRGMQSEIGCEPPVVDAWVEWSLTVSVLIAAAMRVAALSCRCGCGPVWGRSTRDPSSHLRTVSWLHAQLGAWARTLRSRPELRSRVSRLTSWAAQARLILLYFTFYFILFILSYFTNCIYFYCIYVYIYVCVYMCVCVYIYIYIFKAWFDFFLIQV